MSDNDDWDEMWHTGLQARLDTAFPKICRNCGRIFKTAEQYFTETLDISEQDKGLKPFVDDDTSVVIEAFRNCPCGSTLMEMFEDRRNISPEGIARRIREAEFPQSMMVENPLAESASTESPAKSAMVRKKGFARSVKMEGSLAANASRTSTEDLQKSLESGLSDLDFLHAEEKWGREWYSGLRPRGESAFPKKCQNCGRVYETADDFFIETGCIRPEDTGLRACNDEADGVIVEAYRNCICGSTLMDSFSDRRDMLPAGRERRERFDQMLNYLVQIGLNADTAHAELLKVARGGESKILAKIKPPK